MRASYMKKNEGLNIFAVYTSIIAICVYKFEIYLKWIELDGSLKC